MARKANPKVGLMKKVEAVQTKIIQNKKQLDQLVDMFIDLRVQIAEVLAAEPIPEEIVARSNAKKPTAKKASVNKIELTPTIISSTKKVGTKKRGRPAKK